MNSITPNNPRIAGAGICCLDYIVTAPQVKWGDTALVSGYCVQGGGLVATALVACARLGAACELYSILGKDTTADLILDELAVEGVNTEGVVIVEDGGSPFSFIHVSENSGERTIFHRSGVNLEWSESPSDLSRIQECDILLVDDIYPELAINAASEAVRARIPVVADLLPGDSSRELLKSVDVLIAPKEFARRIGAVDEPYRALEALHKFGPRIAVITMGEDGCFFSDHNTQGFTPAYKVEAVDTTGAGDVFHGAFAYAMAMRWSIEKCSDFASAVAAIKCTKPGGRTGLPSFSQVMDFLKAKSSLQW